MKHKIHPQPGYLLAKPYIDEEKVFKSVKETDGYDQISEVLAVGDAVLDDKNNLRMTNVKVGDIIIHAYSNKEFDIDFTKYRNVHFTEIHNIWEVEK